MAIDTRAKRANVVGVGRPWLRHPHPSATKDFQWRAARGLTYGGITSMPSLVVYPVRRPATDAAIAIRRPSTDAAIAIRRPSTTTVSPVRRSSDN